MWVILEWFKAIFKLFINSFPFFNLVNRTIPNLKRSIGKWSELRKSERRKECEKNIKHFDYFDYLWRKYLWRFGKFVFFKLSNLT